MEDRELLELAAKAAGMTVCNCRQPEQGLMVNETALWEPLEDDGDALRLAVKLRLDLSIGDDATFAGDIYRDKWDSYEDYKAHGGDDLAAVRRAIVIAAAEIGKAGT